MRMDNYYLFKRVLKITITILDLFLEMLILCPFTSAIYFIVSNNDLTNFYFNFRPNKNSNVDWLTNTLYVN